MQRWREAVRTLGREPNIVIKASNAAGYDSDPSYESVRAVVLHCIESFGSDRTILATDWPVAGLKVSFGDIYDTLRRITGDMTLTSNRRFSTTTPSGCTGSRTRHDKMSMRRRRELASASRTARARWAALSSVAEGSLNGRRDRKEFRRNEGV